MAQTELDRLREIALGLPEVTERLSHGAPCFFIRDKKPICYFHDAEFHGDGRVTLWCPAGPGVQHELVGANPDRFFRPTPSATGIFADWVGMYLDGRVDARVDWDEVAEVLEDAFRLKAPKKLVALLDERG